MVYIRRYLSGQQATTVTIAQGAITSDKIVDGAVTHPKLAPGSVDSEKVIDSSLKSEDIQDGQIKAVDLAPNAVTTDKILDGAVTTQKLEASIQGIARPLTPGVDTAEIQDAKVTLAKLAPDSVDASKIKSGAVGPSELAVAACEESRIKDGAISTAKIAGSAIDSTKISAGAVDGSAILNGSVGVTELATDSVETIKVKDANITLDKLAPDSVDSSKIQADAVTKLKLQSDALEGRHWNSLLRRESIFSEDFGGSEMSNRWVRRGDPTMLIVPAGVKGLKIETGPSNGHEAILDFGDQDITLPDDDNPQMEFMITGRQAPLVKFIALNGLWQDGNNLIAFQADGSGAGVPNWFARCKDEGNLTEVDTGIAVTAGVEKFRIEVAGGISVKFYIDDALVATINTNIPSSIELQPIFWLEAWEAVAKWFYLKNVNITTLKIVT